MIEFSEFTCQFGSGVATGARGESNREYVLILTSLQKKDVLKVHFMYRKCTLCITSTLKYTYVTINAPLLHKSALM